MLDCSLLVDNTNFPNRVVLQPMEGCDCNFDGSPSELTVKKYMSAAKSGAGTIWFEANAVCPEGRTNQRQMMLTEDNITAFQRLLQEIRETAERVSGIKPVCILQLTHSGRQSIEPMIAYRNTVYEQKRPLTDDAIVTDEYLSTLPQKYVRSALLARRVGFDGVDVKSCHGYLIQELLSAFERPGEYGGSFENRIRLYIDTIRAVREAVGSDMLMTARLSVSDMVAKPCGFGTTEDGKLDLDEPDKLIQCMVNEGIRVLNVTVGNPYYNPHVNRPYRLGAYVPPEPPSVGLERFEYIEKHIKDKFPGLIVVGSGLSYHRDDLIEKSEQQLNSGICDMAGYVRMWLAYPDFYKDYKSGVFDPKRCCLACSKCTELMRNKQVSGCAVFNEYYRELYKNTTSNNK